MNGLAVFGNTILQGSSYLNFGATSGSAGYGIWDNAGTLSFKNSGGTWTALGVVAAAPSPARIFPPMQSGRPKAPEQAARRSTTTARTNRSMIVGNNSGGGLREVHVWDDLTVNNNLTVDTSLTVSDGLTLTGPVNTWAAQVNWPATSAPSGSYGILVGSSAGGYSQFQNASGYYSILADGGWGLVTNGSIDVPSGSICLGGSCISSWPTQYGNWNWSGQGGQPSWLWGK